MPDRATMEYKCNNCGHSSKYTKDIWGGTPEYDDKHRPWCTRQEYTTEPAGPEFDGGAIQPRLPIRLFICPICDNVQARGYQLIAEKPEEPKPEPKKRGRKKTHA